MRHRFRDTKTCPQAITAPTHPPTRPFYSNDGPTTWPLVSPFIFHLKAHGARRRRESTVLPQITKIVTTAQLKIEKKKETTTFW